MWPHETERGVRVSTNKTIYQQGDSIDVDLRSTLPDMPLIVEAVRDEKVVATQTVRLRGGRASVVFPPSEKFQNRVTIIAYAVGVHAERQPGEAEFVGFRNVLFPKNHELNFDVRLAKSTYLPGENVPADLHISGPEGQQLRAAVGVVVVDRAVEERERSDRDLRGNAGFYGYRGTYQEEELQGVRIADLEKLDLSKPLPDGLELVAEILMQSGFAEEPKFFAIDLPRGSVAELFSSVIDPEMNSIRQALTRYYAHNYDADSDQAHKAAYPKSQESLRSILSSEEIDFGALRDPWSGPYRAKFGVENNLDTLEIWTDGPDKKTGTHDDYSVLKMEWEYFKPYGEAISRAVKEFHECTGGYIRDAATLNAELAASGFQFDSWKDPWGHAYKASFSAMQNDYVVTVTSSGPDGVFAKEGQDASDDFDVATVRIDYFKETQTKIDHALSDNFTKTFEYPENVDEFRKVLQKYDIDWDALKDPWGHAYVAFFSQGATYADDVTVQTIPDDFGITRSHTTAVPVTRMVEWIHIRSRSGGEARSGTRMILKPQDFRTRY